MENMDSRRKAFEDKYAHDIEMKFRIEARAVRLLGQWVASQLDLPQGEADLYADRLVRENLKEPGFDDVFRKIREDVSADDLSDHMIDVKLAECIIDAEGLIKTNAA